MSNITVILFLVCATSCLAKDLVVGTGYDTRLVWRTKANYMAFPFLKRAKEVFYSNSEQLLIRGITARDLERTESQPSIKAGGIGFPYVNIRLKSERGKGLNYQIEIYV